MSHVTRWLCSTQINSETAKIVGYCPNKSGDKAFFAYHMTTWSMSHVNRLVKPPHPKSQRL